MREGARERGSGREEQTAERESVGGKMLTLLLHLGERQIEGNKGGKKEGKDQGNMGEGEGRSRSERACVKVAVREGASLIPRASYQTVSRLQQLLSAQNTQALPFQLKGSLTKSKGEKKYPAGGQLGSLQHKGLFGGSSIARAPASPSPRCPHSSGCGGGHGCKQFLTRPWLCGWLWGAAAGFNSPCQPRLWG